MAVLQSDDDIIRFIERQFPDLKKVGYRVRELRPATVYNCIAWAVGITDRLWWPEHNPDSFWPDSFRLPEWDCFKKGLATVGFEPCDSSLIEAQFEKIAIYADGAKIKHGARIETDVLWSSKLGKGPLIEHGPLGLNSKIYGVPMYYLKRAKNGCHHW